MANATLNAENIQPQQKNSKSIEKNAFWNTQLFFRPKKVSHLSISGCHVSHSKCSESLLRSACFPNLCFLRHLGTLSKIFVVTQKVSNLSVFGCCVSRSKCSKFVLRSACYSYLCFLRRLVRVSCLSVAFVLGSTFLRTSWAGSD
jgi:hypothetical protein